MHKILSEKVNKALCCIALLGGMLHANCASACTRALYTGDDNLVITGRSMDWVDDIHSNLWIFPRGMKREGAAGKDSLQWTSNYGSVIVSGYEAGTTDGMNEKGLVANLLYLDESVYPAPEKNKPLLSIVAWPQYVLDKFATVSEAVDALQKEPFIIVAPKLPNGYGAQLHLALSDPTGDSAIFEYIEGKLVIHHGKQYTVMTNSPSYEQQLAINKYWESVGGASFLPGTVRPADRFARVSFLINAIPKKIVPQIITAVPEGSLNNQALASVLSVIRAISVPLGLTDPNDPNLSSTLWRTISDHKNRVFLFDSSTSPNVFWVDLSEIDFSEGAPVKKLKAENGAVYAGNATKYFAPAEPFKFLSWEENIP